MNGLVTKFAVVLPQTTGGGSTVDQLLTPLINLGAVGIVLAWFMVRSESKMAETAAALDRLRQAVNRLAMAHLLEVATREDAPTVVRKQAEAVLKEIRSEQTQTASTQRQGFMP